ncbi:type VI secretion system lipoprotein TssJ [Pararoseomonas sp. SCSIO 73927]|uniref:type VI secretion system lipoprotein TssJ n=1 Tax=Pararoseomonas sp. SCSIO 73927 TaxID=3114537 RepID=UPI0030CB3381
MIHRRPLLVLPALLLARCGAPPPPPPPVLNLTVRGGTDQNPDGTGRAVPVSVRLFFLGGTGKFEAADVFALTEREAATLGADSVGSETVIIRPGETVSIEREMKPAAKFLGAVVLFRAIDGARWRVSQPIAPSGPTRLLLTTSGTTVTLAPAPTST